MALTALAADPRMGRTRLVVIDFEGLTPAGRSPVPVEVAAVTLHCGPDGLTELDQFASLMAPPRDVPITGFDQTSGITRATLATAPAASEVMAELDARIHTPASAAGHAVRLVAHNAATERTLLHGRRGHCPRLARTPLLDTGRCPTCGSPSRSSNAC